MLFPNLTVIDDLEPHSAAVNMAIDELLLREITAPVLRTYRWRQPAVSFGYFTPIGEVEGRWPERELVRRWTGGGIVPHGEDFTYTLLCPLNQSLASWPPLESYCAIHQVVATAMAMHLPDVVLAGPPGPPISRACFENSAQFDLVAGERKVAGAAQRRTRDGLMHQGSIQVAGLEADFGHVLAACLSEHALHEHLSPEQLSAAVDLAKARYSTEEWLRRF